jgi:hypothetical protein
MPISLADNNQLLVGPNRTRWRIILVTRLQRVLVVWSLIFGLLFSNYSSRRDFTFPKKSILLVYA